MASTQGPESGADDARSSPPAPDQDAADAALKDLTKTRPTPLSPVPPRRTWIGPTLVEHSGDPTGPISYLVSEPPRGPDSTPIVIFLHGRGDTPERFVALAEKLGLPFRAIVARGTQAFGNMGGRAWFGGTGPVGQRQLTEAVTALVGLSEKLQKRYPGSPRPALIGFSQGAALVFEAVARFPERWSAGVALSGFMLDPAAGRPASTAVPLLATTGLKDSIVKPPRTAAAVRRLKELGHAPEGFTFNGPHQVPEVVIDRAHQFLRAHLPGLGDAKRQGVDGGGGSLTAPRPARPTRPGEASVKNKKPPTTP